MRVLLLVTIICLGVCLGYSKYLEPKVPDRTGYDGPATFVRVYHDPEGDQDSRWILICAVPAGRIAFDASDAWVREQVQGLSSGQPVRLMYDLPEVATAVGSDLGPPTLRGIGPLTSRAEADPGTLVAIGMAR